MAPYPASRARRGTHSGRRGTLERTCAALSPASPVHFNLSRWRKRQRLACLLELAPQTVKGGIRASMSIEGTAGLVWQFDGGRRWYGVETKPAEPPPWGRPISGPTPPNRCSRGSIFGSIFPRTGCYRRAVRGSSAASRRTIPPWQGRPGPHQCALGGQSRPLRQVETIRHLFNRELCR
jgi:hypothetical protein